MRVASFVYLKPENKKFLENQAVSNNVSMSRIIDGLVASFREDKKYKLVPGDIPQYVRRAEKWKKKR